VKRARIKEEFSASRIGRRVARLGKDIRKDAGGKPVFLIGILKGTAVFLSDLLRRIDGDVAYGFIDEIRDVSDTQIAEAVEIDFLSHFEIGGRQVYLLKDVVSTGVIETYLLGQLRQHNPADIKLVALLDRPALRTMDLKVDYVAFDVDDGAFVGYGLELGGQHANLPYIGRLRR
jgi:hypoxanthine phosphoribosyltransferase